MEEFQSRAQQLLSDRDWKRDSPPEQLHLLLEEGARLPVAVPESALLQGLKEQGHWLAEVRRTLGSEGGERQEVTLEVLRNLMEAGCNVAQSVSVETAMAELQELLTIAERWEEKAQICLEQRSAQRRFLRKQPDFSAPAAGETPTVCPLLGLSLQAEASAVHAGRHRQRGSAHPSQASQHLGPAGLSEPSAGLGHGPGGDPGRWSRLSHPVPV